MSTRSRTASLVAGALLAACSNGSAGDGAGGAGGGARDDPEADWGVNDLAFGNGVFVVVGDGGHVGVYDGSDWTRPQRRATLKNAQGQALAAGPIAFGNGGFLVAGGNAYAFGSEGVSWSVGATKGQRGPGDALVFDGHRFVGVRCGKNADVCVSPDGVTWSTAFNLMPSGPPYFTPSRSARRRASRRRPRVAAGSRASERLGTNPFSA